MAEFDDLDDEPRDKKKTGKDKPQPKRGRDLDDEEDDRDDDRGSKRKRDDDDDDYDDDYDDRKPAPRKRGSQGGGIGDYFSFKKLMIADAIPIVFWVGVVLILGYAGWLMSLSSTLNPTIVPAIIYIFMGVGLWRVACETMAAIARCLQTLTEIKNASTPPPPAP